MLKRVMKVLGIGLVVLVFIGSFSWAEEKGLMGLWHFDENKGEVAKDSSGKGNDGEIYGAKWIKGRLGSALEFNGKDNYVLIKDNTPIKNNNGTISLWAKVASWTSGGSGHAMAFISSDSDYACYVNQRQLMIIKSYISLIFKFVGDDLTVHEINPCFGPEQMIDTWHHFAFTWKNINSNSANAELRVYCDGEEVAKKTDFQLTLSWETFTPVLQIGRDNVYYYFNGVIDEVAIYNRALSAEEIGTYSAGKP